MSSMFQQSLRLLKEKMQQKQSSLRQELKCDCQDFVNQSPLKLRQ